jgi:hypothetical protein
VAEKKKPLRFSLNWIKEFKNLLPQYPFKVTIILTGWLRILISYPPNTTAWNDLTNSCTQSSKYPHHILTVCSVPVWSVIIRVPWLCQHIIVVPHGNPQHKLIKHHSLKVLRKKIYIRFFTYIVWNKVDSLVKLSSQWSLWDLQSLLLESKILHFYRKEMCIMWTYLQLI